MRKLLSEIRRKIKMPMSKKSFGCYTDLSNEDYHAEKEFVSRSAIMDFSISHYTYWAKHLNPMKHARDTTPAMKFGSAFHTYILEPEKFLKDYAIYPLKVLLKDVGREAYDKFKKECEEIETSFKTILLSQEYLTLLEMRNRICDNLNAVNLISNARIENSFFWQDEHSGMLLKARPDILHDNMIVDLKTCSDASPRAYQNEMVKYGYHVQGAMIRDAVEAIEGRRINTVINICIETKYPYNMAIYMIDEFALDEGHKKYKQICLDLKAAREKDYYPDYGIQTISLPKWAI
jgi:PDDEXK-like domain of unknown function (DUF3799)